MPPPQLLWPYWTESDERVKARWKLAGVFALTLGTTGVRSAPLYYKMLILGICGSLDLSSCCARRASGAGGSVFKAFKGIYVVLRCVRGFVPCPKAKFAALPREQPSSLPCSVLFNCLGRDFFYALSAKDQENSS